MQRRKVDLPEPDGPTMQTTSPRLHFQIDALQHLEAPKLLCTLSA